MASGGRCAWVLGVAIGGLVLGACGGASGVTSRGAGGEPAAKPVDARAAFVAKADAICKRANDKEAALGAEGPGWMYGWQFDDVDFLEQFNDAGRVALRDLKKLEPPAGDRARLGMLTDGLAQMVEALDLRLEVLRRGKGENDALAQYEVGYSDLVAAAGPLGLSQCQGVLL